MVSNVKNIVIFGANCGNCKRVESLIKSVIIKYKLQVEVTKCDDWEVMVRHNVLYLPTIMFDNVIKFKGIVPSEKELVKCFI